MSASKVNGKDVVLRAFNTDGYYGFYCAQEVSIHFQTDQLPATTVSSGSFKAYKPGRSSWDVSLTGLAFIRDTSDSNWTFYDLTTEQARLNGLDLQLVFTNENGNTESFTGHANPMDTTLSGSVGGQLAKGVVRFQGTGSWARNAVIPISSGEMVQRYEYTATGGETFFISAPAIGSTILDVERESVNAIQVITSGVPGAKQVKFTSSSGRFDFDGSPAGAGEQFVIVYKT